jgi:hypothetical protein|tara:strand:- start:132 stop:812 length:681 start_codon:yes stop_codon:yes gene_type:complete
MSFLVANLPMYPVLVDKSYLYNGKKGHGEYMRGYWVSVKAQKHRALLFETLLENGALYDKLPISAFVTHEDAKPKHKLHELALWDVDAWNITTIVKDNIRHLDCVVRIGKEMVPAEYICTVDQCDADGSLLTSCASIPREHKSMNLLALSDGSGQIASQPNNRILWTDPSLTHVKDPPDFEACDEVYFSNTNENYCLTDAWFYEDGPGAISSVSSGPLPEPAPESS